MRILLVLSNYPYRHGEAIEVVTHEILRLMNKEGHDLDVQVIIRERRDDVNFGRERSARETWRESSSVNFLPTIYLGDRLLRKGWFRRKLGFIWAVIWSMPILRRRISRFLFPASQLLPDMRRVVGKIRPDIVVGIWSWEALAATYAIKDVPKFMYYGNPDHKPEAARLQSPDLFGIPTSTLEDRLRYWTSVRLNKAREVQHVRMMRHCEMTVNNSLIDAKYYQQMGHPHSVYLQNLWPRTNEAPLFEERHSVRNPVRVVASVGNLGATGNTFGLYFLGEHIAPRLSERFREGEITLDVYGGGVPSSKVASVLDHPRLRLRGWVEDLDAEMRSACAFLVLTNVSGFVVGNTRILLAWSLGCSLVAHSVSALSMPEIVDGENALLGDSPDAIADAICRLVREPDLRAKIGRGGYETYREYYDSETVVPKMLELVTACHRDATGQ